MADLNDLIVRGDSKFIGRVYMNDYIDTKTYTNLYGSADTVADASFYYATIRPITFYDDWKIKIRVYANVSNQTGSVAPMPKQAPKPAPKPTPVPPAATSFSSDKNGSLDIPDFLK